MTHELPVDWINAYLDKELTAAELATAASRISVDVAAQEQLHGLQELDHHLRRLLVAPEFSEGPFLAKLDERRNATGSRTVSRSAAFGEYASKQNRNLHRIPVATVATAVAMLSALVIVFFLPRFFDFSTNARQHAIEHSVAQVVRAIGSLEFRLPQDSAWQQSTFGVGTPFVAGTRVRTLQSSLCEIETANRDVLRLNDDTEVVIHKAEVIELVAGEFWFSTQSDSELTILVPERGQSMVPDQGAVPVHSFACAPDTATQWNVTERETKCYGVQDSTVQLILSGNRSLSVESGQVLSLRDNSVPVVTGWEDPLVAQGWQLPLLVIRRPDDQELQGRLQSLLARIGQTKMSSMYESQIRGLGPAGTIPLIAFVRSSQSLDNPALRHQAMRIIADLAPASTRSDLEVLAMDADAQVSLLATAALLRLKS